MVSAAGEQQPKWSSCVEAFATTVVGRRDPTSGFCPGLGPGGHPPLFVIRGSWLFVQPAGPGVPVSFNTIKFIDRQKRVKYPRPH